MRLRIILEPRRDAIEVFNDSIPERLRLQPEREGSPHNLNLRSHKLSRKRTKPVRPQNRMSLSPPGNQSARFFGDDRFSGMVVENGISPRNILAAVPVSRR